MRLNTDDTFWLVTDPTSLSELIDICFATTLRGLELQFRGGLTAAQNLTLFTERAEAEREAGRRLQALRVALARANGERETGGDRERDGRV